MHFEAHLRDAVKLGETVLSGTSALITFSSIPTTYRSLLIVGQGRGDNASTSITVDLEINDDTAGNYDTQYVLGVGAAAIAAEQIAVADPVVGIFTAASGVANNVGAFMACLPQYAGSTFDKTFLSQFHWKETESTGGTFSGVIHGAWRSTSAITKVELKPSAGNFISGSTFTLYGVR